MDINIITSNYDCCQMSVDDSVVFAGYAMRNIKALIYIETTTLIKLQGGPGFSQ